MLARFLKPVAAAVVAVTLAGALAPAEAGEWRRRSHQHHDNRGAAVAAGVAIGVIGLAAAAIAAEQSRRSYEYGYARPYGYHPAPPVRYGYGGGYEGRYYGERYDGAYTYGPRIRRPIHPQFARERDWRN